MALNFNDVLDKSTDEIERPPLLPVGTYEWLISKIPSVDTTPDEKWDIVNFPLKCVRATDDVDTDALATFGNPVGQFQRFSIMFDKNDAQAFAQSEFKLKRFLEEHVQVDKGLSLKAALNACVNKRIMGAIAWKQDKNDSELFHANVNKTAPID